MEGARASTPAPLNSSGVPPERATFHMLVKPVRFEENTIRVPSRVHVRPRISRLSKVRRLDLPPEVGTTKISWARYPAPWMKATILPSGENAGDARKGPGGDTSIFLSPSSTERSSMLGLGSWGVVLS